jgi:hypothetical protein
VCGGVPPPSRQEFGKVVIHFAKGETESITYGIFVFGPKKIGDEEGGRHECWIMTPFHFHWCPFVKEYALLLTNCTPCHPLLPASLTVLDNKSKNTNEKLN